MRHLAAPASPPYIGSGVLTFSLQSGSNGNSIYVEAGGTRLLFDAGISGLQAETRLAAKGRRIRDCHALFISHDHADHVRCAGIFQRKYGLPVYLTERTHRAARGLIGRASDVRYFSAGQQIDIGSVAVQTIPTPHDGVDPVCFVVAHDGRKLAILTDLGTPFAALFEALEEADAAYLESNYDHEMLVTGSYPEALKQRIMGSGGHLSNDESAELACRCTRGRWKWLALAHLSEENNRPELALAAHRRRLGRFFPLHHASRYEPGELLEV
jgi:phosphoribosyl 1,2-cyclic phosphodiesterase